MRWFVLIAVLLGAGVAHGEELAVSQLAAKNVKITVDNGTWEVVKGGKTRCTLKAANKQLEITEPKCGLFDSSAGEYWADGLSLKGQKAGKPVVIKLTLAKQDLMKGGEALKLTWNDLTPLNNPATVYYYDTEWRAESLANLTGDKARIKKELQVWVPDGNGSWAQVTIKPDEPPPVPSEKASAFGEQDCPKQRAKYEHVNVLCFAYDDSWGRLSDAPGSGVLMRANTRLVVIAYAQKGSVIDQALSGELGFAEPKVRNETGASGTVTAARGDAPAPPVAYIREWGPPKPGVHTLTLTMKAKAPATDDATKIDITVDEVFAGAIRLGVGAVFGGARDRTFAAQALPGSGQAEITTTEGGRLDAELVLGAAVFFDRGGRSYNVGEPGHWAPYLGIGLLNQSQTSFELLKSIHLGFEYEISRQFSIAFTVVGRKVTRLADGLEVGDPISTMTVPTRTGYELGVGVVVNLSPEFLKVAKSPSGGFFK